eukprot:COSAG03_NODE_12825_length_529_cov_1.009302_2_plen_33_part_01
MALKTVGTVDVEYFRSDIDRVGLCFKTLGYGDL